MARGRAARRGGRADSRPSPPPCVARRGGRRARSSARAVLHRLEARRRGRRCTGACRRVGPKVHAWTKRGQGRCAKHARRRRRRSRRSVGDRRPFSVEKPRRSDLHRSRPAARSPPPRRRATGKNPHGPGARARCRIARTSSRASGRTGDLDDLLDRARLRRPGRPRLRLRRAGAEHLDRHRRHRRRLLPAGRRHRRGAVEARARHAGDRRGHRRLGRQPAS